MEKVRAVIRMLEPNIGRIPTKVIIRCKPNPRFRHGTLYLAAVEILKAAGRPLHAMEITWALLSSAVSCRPIGSPSLRCGVRSNGRLPTTGAAVGSHPVHWKLAD